MYSGSLLIYCYCSFVLSEKRNGEFITVRFLQQVGLWRKVLVYGVHIEENGDIKWAFLVTNRGFGESSNQNVLK